MKQRLVQLLVLGVLAAACSTSPDDGRTTPPARSGPAGCQSDADCGSLKCQASTGQCVPASPPTPPAPPKIEGAECSRAGEIVCGVDPTTNESDGTVLFCEGSSYTKVFTCPALQQCLSFVDSVQCGDGTESKTSPYYAKEGAPCRRETTAACSFDKTVMHQCVNGIWLASRRCPPSECTYVNGDVQSGMGCANGGYSLGDRCGFTGGSVACSTDLSMILGCSDGKTVMIRSCGEQKCARTEGGLTCL